MRPHSGLSSGPCYKWPACGNTVYSRSRNSRPRRRTARNRRSAARGAFLVDDELWGILRVFAVTVRRNHGETFAAFAFGLPHGPDFLGCVSQKPFIEQIHHRSKIVFPVLRVHVVIDGDQPHVFFRKYDFGVESDFQVIATEPAHVLDDNGGNLSGFHILHHSGKRGPLEICPGEPVVIDELIRGKAVFFGVPGENFPLINDAVGIALQFVLMAQSSIQVIDFFVRLSVQNILRFRQPTDGNVWFYYIMHYRGCLKDQEVLLGW